MAKAKNKVLTGFYKDYDVSCKLSILTFSLPSGHSKIFMKSHIQSIQPINASQNKDVGSTIARGLVGGFLLGPVGLVGAAILGKNNEIYVLQVTFKSSATCLLEVDGKIYQEILKIMY